MTPRPRPLPKSPLPLFGSPLPRPRALVEDYESNVGKKISLNSVTKHLPENAACCYYSSAPTEKDRTEHPSFLPSSARRSDLP